MLENTEYCLWSMCQDEGGRILFYYLNLRGSTFRYTDKGTNSGHVSFKENHKMIVYTYSLTLSHRNISNEHSRNIPARVVFKQC